MTEIRAQEPTVLVIDSKPDRAATLKEMIEFLDTPAVTTVGVEGWRDVADRHRISAVFLGSGLSSETATEIAGELHRLSPDVPVVVVDERHDCSA